MLLLTNHATSPSYQRKDKYNKTIDSLMEGRPWSPCGWKTKNEAYKKVEEGKVRSGELGLSSLV